MKLKSREQAKAGIISLIDNRTISIREKEFLKQIKEDPIEEYNHTYFNEWIIKPFKRENIKSTIYKTLFVLAGSAFFISVILSTPLSYYLFFLSVIFAAQIP
ncbi:hypothetical protein SOX05_08735 [Pseudomonas putida]|nr:hypothetical protein [Pseudomonas putida]MDY4319347.1 hypothetical protein [Pseudomonas putida]MDY4352732.1 hypothetical protein [Pseudomonas putida]